MIKFSILSDQCDHRPNSKVSDNLHSNCNYFTSMLPHFYDFLCCRMHSGATREHMLSPAFIQDRSTVQIDFIIYILFFKLKNIDLAIIHTLLFIIKMKSVSCIGLLIHRHSQSRDRSTLPSSDRHCLGISGWYSLSPVRIELWTFHTQKKDQ